MILVWPGKPLGRLLLIPALASFTLLVEFSLAPFVYAIDALIAAVAVADLLSLIGAGRFSAARRHAAVGSLEQPLEIEITLLNLGRFARGATVRDDAPGSFHARPAIFELVAPPRREAVLEYVARPTRRGTYVLEQVDLLVSSRLGLWRRPVRVRVSTTVKVYPDIRQIAKFTMLARRDREMAIGVRRTRRLGVDNEFERLRDYVEGDDPRRVDWRATARRKKLTSRAYQQNQSQHVLFLIDCGRLMAGDSGDGLSPLDHALNAMLLLAHVALAKGDRVGLLAYSDRIRAFVAPAAGANRVGRLVHAVHNLFPELVEPRLDRAFLELEHRCRKRSLVVLLTSALDEADAQSTGDYLENLSGRHLPLGVFLRDHSFFAMADERLAGGPALYRAAAAASILNDRQRALARLRRRGVFTLDVFPEQLTAQLVNQYLEIKARHLL